MGVNGKRDDTRYINFQQKTRKTGKQLEKQGKNTNKNRKKNTKLQEIQKRYFDEVPENAETETSFRRDFGKC